MTAGDAVATAVPLVLLVGLFLYRRSLLRRPPQPDDDRVSFRQRPLGVARTLLLIAGVFAALYGYQLLFGS